MKSLIAATTTMAIILCSPTRAENACDEKAEMQRAAEQYRKCAEENKAAKLGECENEAPETVKAAANKVVSMRHKIGSIEEQLAAAYEAGDKKAVQKLYKQKAEAELEYNLAEKEKHTSYALNNVEELVRDMPASADAKQLKQQTEADTKAYLDNVRKMIESEKEQMLLEAKMETIDSKIQIIRKKEELKQLEAAVE